jgi:hypothetical protein
VELSKQDCRIVAQVSFVPQGNLQPTFQFVVLVKYQCELSHLRRRPRNEPSRHRVTSKSTASYFSICFSS